MKIPSIKGIAFKSVVQDLELLVEGGRIGQSALERILPRQDLDFFEEKIIDSKWYPMASYHRMMKLLRDTEGKGKNAYLRERGARTAQRLLDSGIYHQLRYAGKMEPAKTREDAERHVRLIATLWDGIFNVGEWRVYTNEEKPNELGIDIYDAKQIPDTALEAIAGFVDRIVKCNDIPTEDVKIWYRRSDVVRVAIVLKDVG